ncbi:hypothetical protein G6M70_05995 [Agrobacterium tumefaciens]|uniref:hypothetical protein n=1 Tax=Agrobacterium tumefaciens TaxID=358 RepID=UPI001573BF15|nr:hypothetical protein [Agrobacterium tumefaciens]NSZ00620.1 hypothetical protein [Agrobacterium tumefaciens]NSZ38114.1 hypothetical protein [Agrobacterium tumefaciens]NTB25639.1 hypothetical protein [Agrobacterium tumefaciens]NTB27018.1 hypothetical protein [Agrobacterium tumefaciens]NTB32356.1 hypothetical protein [Agrobacterium tumefaciens]
MNTPNNTPSVDVNTGLDTSNIPAFVRNVIETHMSVYQLDTFEKAASVFRYWSSFFEVMAEKAGGKEV